MSRLSALLVILVILAIALCCGCFNAALGIGAGAIAGLIYFGTDDGHQKFIGGYSNVIAKGFLPRSLGGKTTEEPWQILDARSMANFDFVVRYWRAIVSGTTPRWADMNSAIITDYKWSLPEQFAALFEFKLPGVHDGYNGTVTPIKWLDTQNSLADVKEEIRKQWTVIGQKVLSKPGLPTSISESAEAAANYQSTLADICKQRRGLKQQIEAVLARLSTAYDSIKIVDRNSSSEILKLQDRRAELKAERKELKSKMYPALKYAADHGMIESDKLAALKKQKKDLKHELSGKAYTAVFDKFKEVIFPAFANWISNPANRERSYKDFIKYERALHSHLNTARTVIGDISMTKPMTSTVWFERREKLLKPVAEVGRLFSSNFEQGF